MTQSIDLTDKLVKSLLLDDKYIDTILNPNSKEIEEIVNANMIDDYCKFIVSLKTKEVVIWRGEIPYNIVLEQLMDMEDDIISFDFNLIVNSSNFLLGKASYYEGKMALQIVEEADNETEAHLQSFRNSVLWLSDYFSNINIYVDGYAERLKNCENK